MANPLAVIAL
nr:hypothetical protein [Tanacetum cinerariifolium]